jgi:polysaccharide export outer membrane protein
MKRKIIGGLCVIFLLGSCRVPKDVTYFQGIDDLSQKQAEMMNQRPNTRICDDDLLTINVSSWDPTVSAPFNPPAYSYIPQGDQQLSTDQNVFTYLVDREGYINFPILGRVQMAGLTINEANSRLQEMVKETVPDALVNVQIVNFKVGIFGEVARVNTYTIHNGRISIVDLITMAGDLTINANRKNILLFRDNNGQRENVRLDLTDPDIFASPYFYLKQNDMVYVEPNNAKKRNANYSSAQQYTLSIVSTLMTSISVIATIILAATK